MSVSTYRELAAACERKRYRLLLTGDRDHTRVPATGRPTRTGLATLEVRDGDELLARVALREHDLESAARVALLALSATS